MADKSIYKLPEIYTVSYFNESEWNKGLTPEEITKNAEIAELQYQDNLLNGPKVGPGNEQSREKGKAVVGAALAITTILNPPLGIAMTISSGAVGGTAAAAGAINDDDELKEVGMLFFVSALENAAGEVGNCIGAKVIPKAFGK